MRRQIKRRDFLNGFALATGSVVLRGKMSGLAAEEEREKSPDYYPPALTGLRGSHPGSFEIAHSLRDGSLDLNPEKAHNTGEDYDLVVVGGGISGLATAHFFLKQAGPKARVLILENHDDFGGHAKRNEFRPSRMLLGYGGTFSIESPSPYSAVAKGVIEELGVDVPRYAKYFERDTYTARGMRRAIFFDKETFGRDKLVVRAADGSDNDADFTASLPFSDQGKLDWKRLHAEKTDFLPGLSGAEKKAKLARVSYADFLRDTVKVAPEVVKALQAQPHPLFGLGIDAVSGQDAWGLGLPGFAGLNLDPEPGPGMNHDAMRSKEADEYFCHFPDGNATIARLLVRRLIPGSLAGSTVEDIVTARANYARLDETGSAVRIRLNSTVVQVHHQGDPAQAKAVTVMYMRGGKLHRVRAARCVLACWNAVIPYIAPELPETQKQALRLSNKVPIVYTNVVLRNWKAWEKAGVSGVYAPGSYFTGMNLDLPVSIGDYHCSRTPEEPIVVHLMRTPCRPGLPSGEQHRMGRAELFATTFAVFERKIREQMERILGSSGLDPVRDIQAITVNRWPHGYAYQYNSLFDKFWVEGGEPPCVTGRKPFGRLAIANADAGAYAYTDGAIDQAYRAVQELARS